MLYHLADLESDFSVFHRVDDMYALPAPVFFARCYRMPVYGGALHIQKQQQHPDQPQVQDSYVTEELTPDELEAKRDEARRRAHPQALRPGETTRHVPIDQLIRES